MPSPESPSWVMSPDSFGPITTDMTKEHILATDAFREPPYECKYRVDWHSQTYSGKDEYGIEGRTEPILSDIHFDTQDDGKLLYIYAGPSVRTDTGIRAGDTVKQLRAAYAGHHVYYNDPTSMKGNYEAFYGVNGKKSHLTFYADKGIIEGISLEPGVFHDARYFGWEGRGLAACP